MERQVMWASWEGPGLEHLRLDARRGTVGADGVIIGLQEDRAFRLRYTIRCDATWHVREVRMDLLGSGSAGLHLWADGQGRWTATGGAPLPGLEGCLDVDLSATAFTNTLPIRRLGLRPGESAELAVAYIEAPALAVRAVRQRYGCLSAGPEGGLYRYESLPYEALPGGFTADLPVDAEGLVLDYPGLFRRVWSG